LVRNYRSRSALRRWCHENPNDASSIRNLSDDELYDVFQEFEIAIGPYLSRGQPVLEGATVERLARQELAAREIALGDSGVSPRPAT